MEAVLGRSDAEVDALGRRRRELCLLGLAADDECVDMGDASLGFRRLLVSTTAGSDSVLGLGVEVTMGGISLLHESRSFSPLEADSERVTFVSESRKGGGEGLRVTSTGRA